MNKVVRGLNLAIQLSQAGYPAKCIYSIINKAVELIPCPFPCGAPPRKKLDNVKQRLENFKVSLRKLEQSVKDELAAMLRDGKNCEDMDVIVRMDMPDFKSGSPDEEHNVLLYQKIPWNQLFDKNSIQQDSHERVSRLYEYLIEAAMPKIEEKDFLYVNEIEIEVQFKKAIGFIWKKDISQFKKMPYDATNELLPMDRMIAIDRAHDQSRPQVFIPNHHCLSRLLENIRSLIDKYYINYTEIWTLLPEFQMLFEEIDKFKHFLLGNDVINSGELNTARQFNDRRALEQVTHAIIYEIVNFINSEENYLRRREKESSDSLLGPYIIPYNNILTLWTDNYDHHVPVPICEIIKPITDLFDVQYINDKLVLGPLPGWNNNSSNENNIKGEINYDAFRYIDYVTFELVYARLFFVEIDPKTHLIKNRRKLPDPSVFENGANELIPF